jgi:hypothetical protein
MEEKTMKIKHTILREILESKGKKISSFASDCDLNPSSISGILQGYLPIGPVTWEKLRTGLKINRIDPKKIMEDEAC